MKHKILIALHNESLVHSSLVRISCADRTFNEVLEELIDDGHVNRRLYSTKTVYAITVSGRMMLAEMNNNLWREELRTQINESKVDDDLKTALLAQFE